MTFNITISSLTVQLVAPEQAHEILTLLEQIQSDTRRIIVTDTEFAAVLQKIDDATTKTAANVTAMGTISTTIKTEVDTLVAALQNAGVSQTIVDQATAIGTKADALSTASDALVPVLQAIAAEGANNPVPVPVPVPVPPPPAPAA